MGRPRLTTSISSTETARPSSSVGSSAPSLTQTTPRLIKKLLLRTTGILAIISLLGITSAADPGDNNQTPPTKKDNQKTSIIHLDNASGSTAPKPTDSVANPTTNSSTNVSGGASNNSSSSYSVTVNDQPIAVPENGSNHQVITTPDGATTTVTVNNSTSNSGSSFNASSTTTNSNTQHNDISQNTVIEHNFGSP